MSISLLIAKTVSTNVSTITSQSTEATTKPGKYAKEEVDIKTLLIFSFRKTIIFTIYQNNHFLAKEGKDWKEWVKNKARGRLFIFQISRYI